MRVVDPTTGEEVEIKNAEDELDTRSTGENVLDMDLPSPGSYFYSFSYKLMGLTAWQIGMNTGLMSSLLQNVVSP